MKLMIQTAALVGLALATVAHAARIGSLGPVIEFPVPARDIGNDQLGVAAGLTFHGFVIPHVALGVDAVYHYWPTSPGYKAAVDRYLSEVRWVTIDGDTYAFRAVQVTPHVRVEPLSGRRWSPWIQLGGGMYYVDRNLDGSDELSDLLTHMWPNIQRVRTPGWNLSIGCDVHSGSHLSAGIGATMHALGSGPSLSVIGYESETMPGFTAFTAGLHVLFDW